MPFGAVPLSCRVNFGKAEFAVTIVEKAVRSFTGSAWIGGHWGMITDTFQEEGRVGLEKPNEDADSTSSTVRPPPPL